MPSGMRKKTRTQAIGGNAVVKKASRRSCVWVATSGSYRSPGCMWISASVRAQPGHRFVEQARELRPEIVRILAFGHDIGRRENHRVITIALRHQRHGSGIRRRIKDRLRDSLSSFWLEDEIDEFERVLRMRRAFRNRQRVLLPHSAFLWHDEIDFVVLLH